MKEKITKAEFINTWASEWDEITGWKVSEKYHKQLSEQLEPLINQEVEKRIAERMQTDNTYADGYVDGYFDSGKTPPPPITLDEADKLVQQTDYIIEATHQDINPINLGDAAAFFIEGYEYCRSRMTCSEKPNNSQKTEGGER